MAVTVRRSEAKRVSTAGSEHQRLHSRKRPCDDSYRILIQPIGKRGKKDGFRVAGAQAMAVEVVGDQFLHPPLNPVVVTNLAIVHEHVLACPNGWQLARVVAVPVEARTSAKKSRDRTCSHSDRRFSSDQAGRISR